jgi:type IV pilus assembly protein PilE
MGRQSSGFSLIELLIVVAIIGILTMVSVGIFGDSVITANRTDARKTLAETAASIEKCKSLYSAYNSASCGVVFPVTSEEGLYSVTAVSTGATFVLTASPVAGKAQSNDGDCTTFTLANTGLKGATGADTSVCW